MRLCYSASTLSSCIEEEMSPVIIVLPTSNEAFDIFEPTLPGGFSSVNMRLAFDTKTLLPNLISNNEEEKTDGFQKDYNYKIFCNIRLSNEKVIKKKEL